MACEGNLSVNVTCLPFLSVVGSTFILTKSCISSTHEFIASFDPLTVRLRQGLGWMPAWSAVGLACKLTVVSVGRTTTVFDLRRVVNVVADHCMMEDRVEFYSS